MFPKLILYRNEKESNTVAWLLIKLWESTWVGTDLLELLGKVIMSQMYQPPKRIDVCLCMQMNLLVWPCGHTSDVCLVSRVSSSHLKTMLKHQYHMSDDTTHTLVTASCLLRQEQGCVLVHLCNSLRMLCSLSRFDVST